MFPNDHFLQRLDLTCMCFVFTTATFEPAVFQTRAFHLRLVAMLTTQSYAAALFFVARFLQLDIAGSKEWVTKQLTEAPRDVAR